MEKIENLEQIYLQETKDSIKKINLILDKTDFLNCDENLVEVQRELELIKCNACLIGNCQVEKLCNAIEQIIDSILLQNITFSNNLKELLKNIINRLEKIEQIKIEETITLCDRIASGEVVDINKSYEQDKKNETSSEDDNINVKLSKINTILSMIDDLSSQQISVKKQIENLSVYDLSLKNSGFTNDRKELEVSIYNLENLLNTVKENISEIRMKSVSIIYEFLKNKNDEKNITFKFNEENVLIDKDVIPFLQDILNLIVENFGKLELYNGKQPEINIQIKKDGTQISIKIYGNGNRIDVGKIRKQLIEQFKYDKKEIENTDDENILKYLFTPGLTSVKNGLDEVWKKCQNIKGHIRIEQSDEQNEKPVFTMSFPVSLTTENGFFIKFKNNTYFMPSQFVVDSIIVKKDEIINENQNKYFHFLNRKIQLHNFNSIVDELYKNNITINDENYVNINNDIIPVLVVEYLGQTIGIQVDEILSFTNVVIKKLPEFFDNFSPVKGVVLNENNELVPSFYVPYLIKTFSMLRGYELKKTEAYTRKTVSTIMVVDSSQFSRQILSSIFSSNGYYVVQAKDGIEALEIMKNQIIDFVICAKEMPRMNGVILMENINRNENYSKIPVILISLQSTDEEKKELIALGAKDVIEKSCFDRNKLLEVVKQLLH